MLATNVSGSERDDKDWEDVDEFWKSVRWNFARDSRWKGKGKVKDGGTGDTEGNGKAGNGMKDGGKLGGNKGGAPGESKGGGYQGESWT